MNLILTNFVGKAGSAFRSIITRMTKVKKRNKLAYDL